MWLRKLERVELDQHCILSCIYGRGVYGSLHDDSFLLETTSLWSTVLLTQHSKASSESFVKSIYQIPIKCELVVLTVPIDYGPNHFLLKKFDTALHHNIKITKPTSSLWKGFWKRSGLAFCQDHAFGQLTLVFHTGKIWGETYNYRCFNEWKKYLISFGLLCQKWIQKLGRAGRELLRSLITYVTDRAWTRPSLMQLMHQNSERIGMGTKSSIEEGMSLTIGLVLENKRLESCHLWWLIRSLFELYGKR